MSAGSSRRGVPLSRLTTIGTGGPAACSRDRRRWASSRSAGAGRRSAGCRSSTIGLGSNVLAADAGVEALVVRLDGELAAGGGRRDLLIAGGGATNAVCLHARATLGSAASSSRARSPERPAEACG